LREGENTIALRIIGDTSRPYIVPGKEYALRYNGGRVDFTQEKWKWKIGAVSEKCVAAANFYTRPCGAYNAMLAPILGLSADGLIWYQGESNTGQPHNYTSLFTEFVNHIRENFGENLPVIFTQIANYIDLHSYDSVGGYGAPGSYVAVLREQQRQCLKIPNTAMAVTIDCGEYNDLHPADKKSVGYRLALHARRLAYGENIISDGPAVEKVEYLPESQKLVIHFKNSVGLWAKNGHPSLMVLFNDGTIYNLFAAIRDDRLEATVGVTLPRAVRFCWADCPPVPIYNAYGLPASPFEEIIKG
jgi:sialate O-acetylesterase